MSPAQWGTLLPALVALCGAGAAYLKAHTTTRKLNKHVSDVRHQAIQSVVYEPGKGE